MADTSAPGIGFMTLGMLAIMGMRDIHAMGALRTLLAAAINAGCGRLRSSWPRLYCGPHCAVMVAGSLAGGWFGAHYAAEGRPPESAGRL